MASGARFEAWVNAASARQGTLPAEIERQLFDMLEAEGPPERVLALVGPEVERMSRLARRFPQTRVVALDADGARLSSAQACCAGLSNTRFVEGGLQSRGLRPFRPFDAVLVADALPLIEAPLVAFDHIRALLGDRGRVVAHTAYYGENPGALELAGPAPVDWPPPTQEEWRRSIRRAGFDVIQQERLHPGADDEGHRWWRSHGGLTFVGIA